MKAAVRHVDWPSATALGRSFQSDEQGTQDASAPPQVGFEPSEICKTNDIETCLLLLLCSREAASLSLADPLRECSSKESSVRHLRCATLSFTTVLLASPSVSAADQTAPPVGEYYCDYGLGRGQVFGPGRGFFLMPDGHYKALDEEVGTYSYDSATTTISFSGGFFGRMEAVGQFIGGSYNQIDIAPSDGVYTFCSLQ